jgi:hypothetical protein
VLWRFGPPKDPSTVTGTDFVVWDGERASALYALLKCGPAGREPPDGPTITARPEVLLRRRNRKKRR